jgi:hypothetical protein
MKRLLPSLAVLLALGCSPHTEGSGVSKTETRTVAAFTGVAAATGLEVEVHAGAPASVKLVGDDNVLPLVETEVSGTELHVSFKRGHHVRTEKPIHVDVTLPVLKSLSASGGVHLAASGVAADALDVHASSGVSVKVSGTATTLTVEASSGARLDAGELLAKSATVHASSGTSVTLRASESVRGDAASGASVRVLGKPATQSVSTTSGATVKNE